MQKNPFFGVFDDFKFLSLPKLSMAENEPLKENPHELLYRLYRVLLSKYADLINEKEKRTIGEVKALVNPNDLTIQSLAGRFKKEGFVFSIDFLDCAQQAFGFVSDEIKFAKSDVRLSYWLSPKEILEFKVADDEDQSVFLCSLFAALGDLNAQVVIAEMDDLNTHAFVVTEFDNRFFLLDPVLHHSFFEFSGNRQEALAKYSYNNSRLKRFLYKFNHADYEQFL